MADQLDPNSTGMATAAASIAAGRAIFGLAAVAAPDRSLRLLGVPPHEVTATGRVFAGFFGVRELALPALLLSARDKPPVLRPALALAALADLGDAVVLSRTLMRREGNDRANLLLLLSAVIGAGTALAAYRATPAHGHSSVPAGAPIAGRPK